MFDNIFDSLICLKQKKNLTPSKSLVIKSDKIFITRNYMIHALCVSYICLPRHLLLSYNMFAQMITLLPTIISAVHERCMTQALYSHNGSITLK